MIGKFHLILKLSKRMIEERYRGSIIGLFWALLNPLIMLGIYSFVFSSVLGARWNGAGDGMFALYIFPGILLHQFFMETLGGSATSLFRFKGFVTKVVFPLEIIVPVVVLTAFFQLCIGMTLFILGVIITKPDAISLNIFQLPIILAPYIILALGIGWIFAAIGAFFRDLSQMIGIIGTLLLFSSTVFYPLENLPQAYRGIMQLNPITLIVDNIRVAILENNIANYTELFIYFAVSALFFVSGFAFFRKLKNAFADVV